MLIGKEKSDPMLLKFPQQKSTSPWYVFSSLIQHKLSVGLCASVMAGIETHARLGHHPYFQGVSKTLPIVSRKFQDST